MVAKKKSMNFIVKGTVYPFDVMVSVDETDDVLEKRLSIYGYKPGNDLVKQHLLNWNTMGRCVQLPGGQVVMRIRKSKDKHFTIGVICHECLHATFFILEKIGIVFNYNDNDEAFTYLQQYLVEQICRKIIK